MILINRVTLYSYEIHKTELYQCIEHNINNSFIDKIVIFSNNANIKLPNHEKVILVIKHKFSERDIVNYCKSRFNSNVYIYSNPFVKFDNSLIRVEEPDKECQVFNSDVFIFSNKSIIKFGDDIDNLFFRYEIFSKLTVSKVHNWTEDVRYDSTLNFKREVSINKEVTIRKSTSMKVEENNQDEVEDLSNVETFEEIKPEVKIVPVVRRQVGQNNLNENILVKKASKTNSIISKIDIIIVSVNYNDYLSITLPENLKYNKNITVVTIGRDKECQRICENLGVRCIVSNRIYQNGDEFNKGKAINDGIKSLDNPDWILLLDADTFLTEDINNHLQNKLFTNDTLIICKRLIVENHDDYLKWKNGSTDVGIFEKAQGFGYFQLFNRKNLNGSINLYPENYTNASSSDLYFRSKFNSKIEIESYVVHLGETNKNWSGRVTKEFIEKKSIFSLLEDLPFYIDKTIDYQSDEIVDDNQFIIHVTSIYKSDDSNSIRRTNFAKSTWKKLYENNKIIPAMHYTNKQDIPKIKDLFEYGYSLCVNEDDIIMYTNSDICLTSDLYQKIIDSCNKYDCTFSFRKDFLFTLDKEMDNVVVEKAKYSGGNETPTGADLFAVTKSWWEKWRNYLPNDQVIGRPTWDWIFRITMGKSIEGDIVFEQTFEEQGSVCETPNITYHEYHNSFWERPENLLDKDSLKNSIIAYNWMKEKSNIINFTGKEYFENVYGENLNLK